MAEPWWKTAVLYQIYPRSFQDSNGDGIGDLGGIVKRLPYLAELGIDAIWLSPIFVSPMADFGYDIANYTAIDPLFGSIDDFDAMVGEAHARGIKLLLDFVPNHTSDRHPWFAESRASRNNPKRDWYIWRNGTPEGGPPNNWLSEFGGSAWAFDAASGQYYYHAFLAAQPDLNWRNVELRAAMHDVMRFWLRRGVDGFRVDVIWHLIKDSDFRDNPPNPDYHESEPPYRRFLPLYSTDRPEVHNIIRELRGVIDEFPERVLIGEIYLAVERLAAYYGRDLSGVHLPFNFSLIETPWRADAVAQAINRYEAALPAGAWPNWVLGNHDRPRFATRVGAEQTPVAAMLLLTLRGTPTLYYGDEIGMQQVPITSGQLRDPVVDVAGHGIGRDGCRTPMQWDTTIFAGFSCTKPWLPLAENFATCNVAYQSADDASLYNLYRRLITVRRTHQALQTGAYTLSEVAGDVLAFTRERDKDRMCVALNFGTTPGFVTLPAAVKGRIVFSTLCDREDGEVRGHIDLRGNEGLLVKLD